MTEPIRDTETAVRELGALPVPVGTAPLTAEHRAAVAKSIGDAKPATGRLLEQLAESVRDRREHEHPTWEDLFCLNLVSWAGERMGPVLRRLLDVEARVVELEAERQTTNEALSDAAEELRANRDRIAELEAAQTPGETYPPALPWARLMDHQDLADFLDELAASAITHAAVAEALAEVEATCGRWRVIAEAQHAHNTAPGPDVEADGITRRIVPVQALRDDEPQSKFFQPGRTYVAGNRFRFRCDAVTTHPATGEKRAMGWHGKLRTADSTWVWVANERTPDDWEAWTEVVEAGDA